MPGAADKKLPSAAPDAQTSPLRAEDERIAASIAGVCDAFLKESGFSLIEVNSGHATYRNGNGHQITIQGDQWFCKLSSGAELSGVGFVDLCEVVRGG